MAAPQLQLLFLAISLLASVAAAGFLGAWLATRRGAAWWAAAGQIVGLAASWYCVSMTLTLFNRLMLGFTAFNFPITMSLSHMAIKGVLGVALAMEAHKRAAAPPGASPLPAGWLARQRAVALSLIRSQRLTRRVFSRILVPLGTTTALDVWLSAVSLQTLEISVYTTAKSCALIFTLGFSLAARLQQPTWGVVGTVLMIGAGVILCSIKPAGVDAVGLVCVLIAAACGAARWVFTEQFYKRPGTHADALALVALLSPITVLTLVPGLGWEAPRLVAHSPVHTPGDVGVVLAMTLGGGVLAFLLLIVELQLVGMTSALTLNVIGHLKDVVVIGLAIPVLHEELSPVNAAGVALTLVATLLYSVFKSRAHSAAAADAASLARARQLLDESWAGDPEPGDGLMSSVPASAAAAAAAVVAGDRGRSGRSGGGDDDDDGARSSAAGVGATPHGGYAAVATRTPGGLVAYDGGGGGGGGGGSGRAASPSGTALLAAEAAAVGGRSAAAGGSGAGATPQRRVRRVGGRSAVARYQGIPASGGEEEEEENAEGEDEGGDGAGSPAFSRARSSGDDSAARALTGSGGGGSLRLPDDALGALVPATGADAVAAHAGGAAAAAAALSSRRRPAMFVVAEDSEDDEGARRLGAAPAVDDDADDDRQSDSSFVGDAGGGDLDVALVAAPAAAGAAAGGGQAGPSGPGRGGEAAPPGRVL